MAFPTNKKERFSQKTRRKLKPSNQPTKMLLCFGLIQFCVPKICARKEPLPKLSCSSYTLLHLSTCVRQQCLLSTNLWILRSVSNLLKKPIAESNSKFIYRQASNIRNSVLDWWNLENLLDTVGLLNSKKC